MEMVASQHAPARMLPLPLPLVGEGSPHLGAEKLPVLVRTSPESSWSIQLLIGKHFIVIS